MDENENKESHDFGAILAEFEQAQPATEGAQAPKVGDKVSGKILSIGPEAAFVDLGGKAEGMIELAQIKNAEGEVTVQVGDTLEATVTGVDSDTGSLVLKRQVGRGSAAKAEIEQAHQAGVPVEGLVTAVVKGGVEVQVSGLRGFCPVSQLDLRYVEDPERFVGQRLTFRVTKYEEGGKGRRPNIILSRRALLEEEQKSKAAETREKLHPGAIVRGKVTSLTDYGAFIDLGGLEGMLHVSEIGYARTAHPKDVLNVGEELDVQVLKIEPAKGGKQGERISLSRKSLESDPWKDAADRFPDGTKVKGRVMRLETFGAFIEVAPGLEGLAHISELGAGRRVNHAREVLQLGQDVEVTVLGVDTAKRRISLSLQGESEERVAREPRVEREPPPRDERPRQPRGPRERNRGERGGDRDRDRDRPDRSDREEGAPVSSSSGGSGFGSMADFFRTSQKKP
ncbi:MAG TPA: S1 RNA-binding domain-containing protein [Thermoanaerobaculia bacterium]|nr:S1 RNA-binding domain-containing protein [Thermoanaerobaculia bacterium]